LAGRLFVGTSGWHYDHWTGPFYPDGLPAADRLAFYARRFRSVEINASFYRLPARATLETWRATVGPGFVFAAKASRYATHMKKLKDPAATIGRYFEAMSPLAEALAVVLYQLPPRWRCNVERLAAFLDALPPRPRAAFEFRDPSWFCAPVYDTLTAHGAAFCIHDLEGRTAPDMVTADFVYLRLHGPDGAYRGRYGRNRLKPWVRRARAWRDEGRDVYCYFDNDENGYAAADAQTLRDMAG